MNKAIQISGVIVSNQDKGVYDWLGMDATCPKDVLAELEKIPKQKAAQVTIGSPGGDLLAGTDIYTALLQRTPECEILITSEAASAASLIAMGGRVTMSPAATMMIHNVRGGVRGDHRTMNHYSEFLRINNMALANAYMAKTGLAREKILEMMDNETTLDAVEAVKLGFADAILDTAPHQLVATASSLLPEETVRRVHQFLAQQEEERKQHLQNEINELSTGGYRNE